MFFQEARNPVPIGFPQLCSTIANEAGVESLPGTGLCLSHLQMRKR